MGASSMLTSPEPHNLIYSANGQKWFQIAPSVWACQYGQVQQNPNDKSSWLAVWKGPISGKVKVLADDFGSPAAAMSFLDQAFFKLCETHGQQLQTAGFTLSLKK